MNQSMQGLAGRNALVTGGGTGIGYGCAESLLRAGSAVTIAGRREDVLVAAAESLRQATGGDLQIVVCDITIDEQVKETVHRAARGGNLDIAVFNAGSGVPGAVLQLEPGAWEWVLKLNIVGNASCIKHAGLIMKEHGGGSMVLISSTSGAKVQPWMAAYNVAKAGVDMLTRCASVELAQHAIRVNSIQPGYIPTEAFAPFLTQKLHDTLVRATPLGRVGKPSDIGAAVTFLASDEAKWITGQTFGVDGGLNVPVMPSMADIAEKVFGAELVASYNLPELVAAARGEDS